MFILKQLVVDSKIQQIVNSRKKILLFFMHMIRSTIVGENNKKENKSFNNSSDWKTPNQQNKPNYVSSYKPAFSKFTHGIGLSLKPSQNRQIPTANKQTTYSQQLFDIYLQKVMKSNLEKMTHIRIQHQKQKQNLLVEIKSLKSENGLLKHKIQELNCLVKNGHVNISKQLPKELQKRIYSSSSYAKNQELNPEKFYEGLSVFKELTEKTEKLSKQKQDYKKQYSMLLFENRELNQKIQRQEKQSIKKMNQLQNIKKCELAIKNQLQTLKQQLIKKEQLIRIYQNQLQRKKQCEIKQQKQNKKEKVSSKSKQNNQNLLNQSQFKSQPSNLVDKRVVKHLESLLAQKQLRIYEKDTLIDELNEKIISNGLTSLSTKYRYLMKN